MKHVHPQWVRTIAAQPIIVPPNPFWDVFRRFGRDEAIAMVINVLGTIATQYLLPLFALSVAAENAALAVVGPVIEKLGFFPGHFKEAWDVYTTTPVRDRGTLWSHVKRAFKGSGKSLLEDVLVHDPVYIILMYLGLHYSHAPVYLLAMASFITAVFIVAGLEVGVTECLYHSRKKRLKKIGFDLESYLEARFLLSREQKPLEVLTDIARHFKLPLRETAHYHDQYIDTTLSPYSGRIPHVRLRRRVMNKGHEVKSVQIVYTRSSQVGKGELEQFRYFPVQKDKFYFLLEQEMPRAVKDIQNQKVRKFMSRVTKKKRKNVHFTRMMVRNPTTLLVSVDAVSKLPVYVLEVKVRNDVKLLKEAMRYIMLHFPVTQTTYKKVEMT
ncbi:hypothetical protein HY639_02390 [Candidatus Woesearchaeota archaeon]|nr:hypothetical protein [Candidatus Woesearchaeota archaeon]